MWQSKREISQECNDIIGSAKGSQISEKYWGEVGKGKWVDVYLEVRKRRGHICFEWNKCLCVCYRHLVINSLQIQVCTLQKRKYIYQHEDPSETWKPQGTERNVFFFSSSFGFEDFLRIKYHCYTKILLLIYKPSNVF